MSREYIGCCGAYCGTCKANGVCVGCRSGYADGSRDLDRARCAIKVCCLRRGLETCADCPKFGECETLQGFYGRKGEKYARYRQSAEFIRSFGYEAFLASAVEWSGAYGALEQDA